MTTTPRAGNPVPGRNCKPRGMVLQSRMSRAKGYAMARNTICLWYDKDAEAAARFYAETFPDSAVGAVRRPATTHPEEPVRLVQRQVGRLLANHAARADRGAGC